MTVTASSLSPAQHDTAREKPRRPRLIRRRIRLSTLLLMMVIVALLVGLYDQRRRQALLLDRLSVYRNLREEGIERALDLPIPLTYADGSHLDAVLKEIKAITTKNPRLSKLAAGFPIYVDPLGIQEARCSLTSRVKRPPSADTLTLGEHLARVLDALGLAYSVKDGFIMITSKESLDVPVGEEGKSLFRRYRDVLE